MEEDHPAGEGGPTPAAYIQKAQELNAIEREDMALKTLMEGLAAFPDSGALLGQVAYTELLLERYADAERSARETLALDPTEGLALWVLARCLMHKGQNQQAEQVLLEGLRQEPDDPNLLTAYGGLLHRAGQLDKAERVLRRALQVYPDMERAHSMLALVMSEQREVKTALDSGSAGIGLAPDDEYSHFAQGIALYQSGHPFKARKHLREALRLDPGDEEIEEIYLEVDKACRWIFLPMYYWSHWIERLPGQQFFVWGVVLVAIYALQAAQVAPWIVTTLALSYLAFCIYSWFANFLVTRWVRFFPPR